MTQLDLLDYPPSGVPADVWSLFVREADKVRTSGRSHYGARTILEVIRHNEIVHAGNRDFVINNNWQADMARAYMRLRGCHGFFETRDRQADAIPAIT
jgi:hypothetical protein